MSDHDRANPPPVPERWKQDKLREALDRLGAREVAERASDGWMIELPVGTEIGGRAQWKARHYRFAGNVMVSMHWPGDETLEQTSQDVEKVMGTLVDLSLLRLPLSRSAVLLLCETPPSKIFTALLETLDPRRMSFEVIDLVEGRGWAWDARDGRVTEIRQASPKKKDAGGGPQRPKT